MTTSSGLVTPLGQDRQPLTKEPALDPSLEKVAEKNSEVEEKPDPQMANLLEAATLDATVG